MCGQANDLVFIKNSPDYCHSNHTIGSLGKHGRWNGFLFNQDFYVIVNFIKWSLSCTVFDIQLTEDIQERRAECATLTRRGWTGVTWCVAGGDTILSRKGKEEEEDDDGEYFDEDVEEDVDGWLCFWSVIKCPLCIVDAFDYDNNQ